jgi:hypothetical protein
MAGFLFAAGDLQGKRPSIASGLTSCGLVSSSFAALFFRAAVFLRPVDFLRAAFLFGDFLLFLLTDFFLAFLAAGF